MIRSICLAACLTAICCLISGCAVTLGPQTKTEILVVKTGKPVRILENRALRCRTLAAEMVDDNNVGGGLVKQDVAGWIAMPKEHWDALLANTHRLADRIKELQAEQENAVRAKQ